MRYDQVPQRRAYRAALYVAVELATNGFASLKALQDLEAEYLLTRQNLFQAFASYALYAGLISVGRFDAAESLLKEYLSHYRREPWAPPDHLLKMMMGWIGDSNRENKRVSHRKISRPIPVSYRFQLANAGDGSVLRRSCSAITGVSGTS